MTNTFSLGSHLSWWHTAYGNLMQTNETQLRMWSDLQMDHQVFMEKMQADDSQIKQLNYFLENLQWQQHALEENIALLNKIKQDLEKNLQDMNLQLKREQNRNKLLINDLEKQLSLQETKIKTIESENNREKAVNKRHVSSLENSVSEASIEKEKLQEQLHKLSEKHGVELHEFRENSDACSSQVKGLQSKITSLESILKKTKSDFSSLESNFHKTRFELSSTKKRYSEQEDELMRVSKSVEARIADEVDQAESEWKDEFEHSQRYINELNELREKEKGAYQQQINLIMQNDLSLKQEITQLKQLSEENQSNYKKVLSRNIVSIQELEQTISEKDKEIGGLKDQLD